MMKLVVVVNIVAPNAVLNHLFVLKNIWITIFQLLAFMEKSNPLDFLSICVR